MSTMLDWALWYNASGICVVPVKHRHKAVALLSWDEYHDRQSAVEEIRQWWGHRPNLNIGLVHGVNNFVSIDFDHDAGRFAKTKEQFPALFEGRIEQSGSGEGYHIPLFLEELPALGWDNSKDRPKGNKTWKCGDGDVNIRARWCQTVAPPSIHPTGNRYKFIQKGHIVKLDSLDELMQWLNQFDKRASVVPRRVMQTERRHCRGGNVKDYFTSVLEVFDRLGVAGRRSNEPGGGIRIHDNGGLVIADDDARWYCFSDETGGDVIDAVGWCLYRSSWNRYDRRMFLAAIDKMKDMAGIGDVRAELPRVQHRRIDLTSGVLVGSYWG